MNVANVNISIDLTKGQRLDLTKTNPGLKVVGVGLGWDVQSGSGQAYDLDAFILGLTNSKLVDAPGHVLMFNSPKLDHAASKALFGATVKAPTEFGAPTTILNQSLVHSGDNITGAGDGDDETMVVDFSKIPAGINELIVCANIYEAVSRGNQNFGMVNNAFVRIYNYEDKKEICHFDLSEDYSANNAMVMGKLYFKDNEWKFQAIGEGKNGSIIDVAKLFS